MQHLENQIGQLATTVSCLEAQYSGKLPSQTVVNPRENASAVATRSGKQQVSTIHDEGTTHKDGDPSTSQGATPQVNSSNPCVSSHITPPPFPCMLKSSKKDESKKELLETFRKVEVNIPRLYVVKQVPRYAKFLKKLCTSKRCPKGNEKAIVDENVSDLIQKKMPNK